MPRPVDPARPGAAAEASFEDADGATEVERTGWGALALSAGELVDALMAVHGAVHACVAPGSDGVSTAERGSGGAAAAEGLAWSRRTATAFGSTLEDVVLTTREHHHLARTLGGSDGAPPDVVYLCVQRGHAPLDTARRELATCLSRLGTLPAPPSAPDVHPPGVAPSSDGADAPGEPDAVDGGDGATHGSGRDGRRGAGRHRSRAVEDPAPLRDHAGEAPVDLDPAAAPDPVLALTWAEDVETVRRLLAALTRL